MDRVVLDVELLAHGWRFALDVMVVLGHEIRLELLREDHARAYEAWYGRVEGGGALGRAERVDRALPLKLELMVGEEMVCD